MEQNAQVLLNLNHLVLFIAEQTDMFNIIVDNNGSLVEFYHSIDQLVKEGYL